MFLTAFFSSMVKLTLNEKKTQLLTFKVKNKKISNKLTLV